MNDNTPRSALIKKGNADYQPAPIFDGENFHGSSEEGEDFTPQVLSEEERSAYLSHYQDEAAAILAKANADAEVLLTEAQKKSNKLVEQSKLYCQTAHANAEREGFSTGQEKGRMEAHQELENVIEAVRHTLKETQDLHDALAHSMEPGLAKLAIEVAEKVIEEDVKVDSELVLRLVKAHLEKARDRDQVILRVNPDDFDLVKQNKALFSKLIPDVKSLDVVSEPKVSRGSCMVETNFGTVDATFTTQLEAIRVAFERADKEAPTLPKPEEPHAAEN